MSQVSYGSVTITDMTDITDMFLQYALAVDNAEVDNDYQFNDAGRTGEIGWFSLTEDTTVLDKYYFNLSDSEYYIVQNPTGNPQLQGWYESSSYPEWQTGYQIWCREVRVKEGIDVLEYGTPYLDTAVNQINTEVTSISNLLGGHFIYKSNNSGTSTPSGAGVIQTINDNPASWGYNTWIGSDGIQLRTGETPYATLNGDGLILSKGGIKAKLDSNDRVYLSSEDYPSTGGPNDININGNTVGWRQIIGNKFGVTNDGTLYAKGVQLEGLQIESNGKMTIGNPDNFHIYINANRESDPDFGLNFYNGPHDKYITVVTFSKTIDTTVDNEKSYYMVNEQMEPVKYIEVVPEEGDNPQSLGWYEITQKPTSLTQNTTYYHYNNDVFEIVTSPNIEDIVDYYIVEGIRVAYINGNKMSIPYTVVLKAMQVSDLWSWTLNEETQNLTLQWLG